MNIVRRGAGHILVQSKSPDKTLEAFQKNYDFHAVLNHSELVRDAYLNALSLCDGDDTIVMIVSKIEENSPVRIKKMYIV